MSRATIIGDFEYMNLRRLGMKKMRLPVATCAVWDVCFAVDELGQTSLDGSTPDNQALQHATVDVQLDRQHDGCVHGRSLFQVVDGDAGEYSDSTALEGYRTDSKPLLFRAGQVVWRVPRDRGAWQFRHHPCVRLLLRSWHLRPTNDCDRQLHHRR